MVGLVVRIDSERLKRIIVPLSRAGCSQSVAGIALMHNSTHNPCRWPSVPLWKVFKRHEKQSFAG